MIKPVDGSQEGILLIETDPEISQLIAEQTLKPLGYRVDVVASVGLALEKIEKASPDVILTDLTLPELSAKDLLVALQSRHLNIPTVVIGRPGQETDILQAYRLGADDFLMCPIREAEVASVVENVLARQKNRIGPETAQQLLQSKAGMERMRHDFGEIFSLSTLLRNGANRQSLFERIAAVGIQVAEADSFWILASNPKQNKYILQACQNGPAEIKARLYLPYEDELSSLVAVTGEAAAIHGEAIKRLPNLGAVESLLAVPIKLDNKVSAIITAARNTPRPFNKSEQAMLELVAAFTSILLENNQRSRELEQRLAYLKQSNLYAQVESDLKYNLLNQASLELRPPLRSITEIINQVLKSDQRVTREQAIGLRILREEAESMVDITDSMVRIRKEENSRLFVDVDLNEVARERANHLQPIAQMADILIKLELPSKPIYIKVFPTQISEVIDGLLTNAIKYSPLHGLVTVQTDQRDGSTHLTVKNQAEAVDARLAESAFDQKSSLRGYSAHRYGGLGISLPMIKEIITAYRGSIWIDTPQEGGFSITFSLPRT